MKKNNNNYIIFKMAAKMAAENPILMYLELRYIGFRFSAAILAAILENMQLLLLFSTYLISTSYISYELTLHLSLYLKAELRYIRSRISAAILAAILNFLFSLY